MSSGALKQGDEFSPGDVCDGYRIVALIAAGGMGDVYEAVHERTRETVAFKCLKVRHRSKEDARARMKMEAVVLSELQHENLVRVFDAGVTDAGMVWIAMERLHGQTLRDLLHRGGALPISEALHYASEIAEGVDAVHEVSVIHRDLKPENVFLTTRKVIKVLDLGTGKFTGYGLNSTDRMRILGTTAYMSPEQIKGLRIDVRADIYALGLMVYEMIAGYHPLAPDGGIAALPRAVEQLALMQLQITPRALADVARECPRYISAAVERAMAKDRDARYPSMTAFARELRASRKRFVAENRLDEGTADVGGQDRGLRAKFGAPPRQSSNPPPPPLLEPGFGDKDTLMDLERAHADEVLHTDREPPPVYTSSGLTPVSAGASYEPTLQLSNSSEQPLPLRTPSSDRAALHRTTNTNPLLFARSDLTPEPLSFSGPSRTRLSWLRHPVLRRTAATLGLGALIGVPPAVLGVWWTVHRRTAIQTAAPASSVPDEHRRRQEHATPAASAVTAGAVATATTGAGPAGAWATASSLGGAALPAHEPPASEVTAPPSPPVLVASEHRSSVGGSATPANASVKTPGGTSVAPSKPARPRPRPMKARDVAPGVPVASVPAVNPGVSSASAAPPAPPAIILPPSGL